MKTALSTASAMAVACLLVSPALAQQTGPSPSQLAPQSLRPYESHDPTHIVIPDKDGLRPPAGAEALSVVLGAVTVEGGFPEVAKETVATIAGLQGKRVTLAQIYAAASAIESAHARAGYVLARVAVPPQTLADGATLRIVVVDGFIQNVSVAGVPARVRAAVSARLASLKDRRHLTLDEISQPLLIAGDIPGFRLTSTLVRGDQAGGTKLLLDGRHHLVSGAISFDNNLSSTLQTYGANAQISLNSALGLGEQVYGFAGSGYDIAHLFSADAKVRVLGAGVAMPVGDGRLTLNPEVTFARTQPKQMTGVPLTRGNLRRLTLRAGYVLERRRDRSWNLTASVEQIDETNDLIQFASTISHDRFIAMRIGLDYTHSWTNGKSLYVNGQITQGLGGLGALRLADLPAGTTYSREGAGHGFTRLNASLRASVPLPNAFWFSLTVRGQTGFGKALFRSEQALLEGSDGLSAYVGAVTSVDSAITLRSEIAHPFTLEANARLVPYSFAAGGTGRIERPTALEPGNVTAGVAGVGLRLALPKAGLSLSGEYAHGFSSLASLDGVNRLNISASLRF